MSGKKSKKQRAINTLGKKHNSGRSKVKQWLKRNRFCGGVISARPYATYRALADGTTAGKVG